MILNKKQSFIIKNAKGISVSDIARKHKKYLPVNLYPDVHKLVEYGFIEREHIGCKTLIKQTVRGRYSI